MITRNVKYANKRKANDNSKILRYISILHLMLLFIPAFYSVLYKVDYSNYEFNEKLLN